MKKAAAVLLAILLIIPASVLAASAGTEDLLTAEQAEAAAESVLLAFAGADEDAEIIIDRELTANFSDGGMTAEELAGELDSIVLVEKNAESEKSLGQAIADNCVYTVTVLEDGKKTVYIAVDLDENPELFNVACLQDAVKAMYENQKAYVEGEENISLLGYNDIAGELALHMIAYAVLNPVQSTLTGKLRSIFESARVADLNIDESRFPRFLITFIGEIIMNVFALFR